MYFQLQIECHPYSEGNQTSLTSLSKTLLWQYWIPLPPTPRLPKSLGVFLVISGPLGFQLKPCLLKGFPTSAEPQEKPGSWMCIHRGHPLHPRPQSGGTRHHLHQVWRVGVGGTGRPGTQCCWEPQTQKLHCTMSWGGMRRWEPNAIAMWMEEISPLQSGLGNS